MVLLFNFIAFLQTIEIQGVKNVYTTKAMQTVNVTEVNQACTNQETK